MKSWVLIFCLVGFTASLARGEDAIDKILGLPYGNPETFAEFHGFLTLDYRDFGRDGERGGNPAFDQSNFYFNSIANIRQNLIVFGEVEYKHGGGEIKLDRAFLDWKIDKGLALFLGKFYAPFGLEIRDYQAPIRRLVSRPFLVDDLLYHEWVEVGVGVSGVFPHARPLLLVDLAVVNGPAGLRREDTTNQDNNRERFFIGRVEIVPSQAVTVGGSYAAGTYDDAAIRDLLLLGLNARLQWKGLDLRGEGVRRYGDDQEFIETTIAPATVDGEPAITRIESKVISAAASGYYLQASYRWVLDRPHLYALEPVVRHDVRDPNRRVRDNGDRSRWAFGLNVLPYPHVLLRVEYDWTDELHGDPLKNNAFLAQAVVDF